MKKQMLFKTLALVIAIITICYCFTPAFAVNEPTRSNIGEIAPLYNVVSSINCNVYQKGLYIHVDTSVSTFNATKIKLTVTLQKEKSDGTWETKEEWQKEVASGKSLTLNEKKLAVGGTYRALVYCVAGYDKIYKVYNEG